MPARPCKRTSALIENLKASLWISRTERSAKHCSHLFTSVRLKSVIPKCADTFFISFIDRLHVDPPPRSMCIHSYRAPHFEFYPLENQPDHVCLCNMGDANVSIRARSDYSRIGRDSPPVSLFLTGFRKTWVAYHRGRTGVGTGWGLVDDNGRGLSRCNRRDTGYLLVRQPYLSYLSYRLTSIKRSN